MVQKADLFFLQKWFPLADIGLIVYDFINSDNGTTLTGIGAALLLVGIAAIVYSLCTKPVPEVIIGTRCPQFSEFAITLSNSSDRIKLLDEISRLIAKQH